MRTPNTPEPAPTDGAGRPIWELVMEDMAERHRIGTAKYGKALRARDSRYTLVDAYQEALDLAVYLRKEIAERDFLSSCTCHVGTDIGCPVHDHERLPTAGKEQG